MAWARPIWRLARASAAVCGWVTASRAEIQRDPVGDRLTEGGEFVALTLVAGEPEETPGVVPSQRRRDARIPGSDG